MTWTSVEFPYSSALTATKMSQLQANFAAIANADAGAPSVETAAFSNSAINQIKLKTTTASGSVAVAANGSASYTLTGGTYSWWTASSTGGGNNGVGFGNGDVAAGVIGLQNGDVLNAATFYVDERYVQSSPPYDLGDGEIPLFVFFLLDSSGEIVGRSVAKDPPWANNGPTIITPEVVVQGAGYRLEMFAPSGRQLSELDREEKRLLLLNKLPLTPYAVQIDQRVKNKDCLLIPTNFCRMAGVQAMLNPFDRRVLSLSERLDKEGARAVIQELEAMKFRRCTKKILTPRGVILMEEVA